MFETDTSRYYARFYYSKFEVLLERLESKRKNNRISDKTLHLFKLYLDVALTGITREPGMRLYKNRVDQLMKLIDIKLYELTMFPSNATRKEAKEWAIVIAQMDELLTNPALSKLSKFDTRVIRNNEKSPIKLRRV